MSRWDMWGYEEMVDLLSDYHKDVHGYRLRMNGEPREAIIAELDSLDRFMENMRSTPEGRARLLEDGWEVEEPNC